MWGESEINEHDFFSDAGLSSSLLGHELVPGEQQPRPGPGRGEWRECSVGEKP